MAYVTDPLIVQYRSFLTDLTTVEKRSIVGLTEIARDTLRTQPYLAPSLAQAITTRILEAPPQHKLPSLYLMDSITKNIGEPFKSCFAATLPETYMNVWSYGGPTLHKALDKLLATWKGVFPQPVLDMIAGAKMAAVQPVQYGAPSSGQLKPMMPDPRLSYGSGVPQQPLRYEYPQPSTYSYPVPSTSYGGAPAIPQLSVSPDLVALLSSGILSQKGGVGSIDSGKGRRRPANVTFSQDNIKEPNPDAIDRLLNVSEQTKRNFLDRKFLKRQKISSGQRSLRLWYVDLDTWMAGNVRHEPPSAGDGHASGSQDGGLGEIPPPGGPGALTASVTADEDQTHCALSGEKFEQYWDENYQEWRYKGAKRLAGEEAARYGLKDGALVLLSALGGLSSAFVKQSNEKVNEVREEKNDMKEVPGPSGEPPSGEQLSIQVKEEEERPPKRVKADDP